MNKTLKTNIAVRLTICMTLDCVRRTQFNVILQCWFDVFTKIYQNVSLLSLYVHISLIFHKVV